jgi:hypothetical protein
MSYWILLVAPLVLASLVMLFAFVGCGLDTGGLGGPLTYEGVVTNNEYCVGYWRLGERAGSTTVADSKGDNDGTVVGGVTLGQPSLLVGDANTAAKFDGSSGYVSVPYVDALNPAKFTVEAIVDVAGGENAFRAVVSSRDIDGDGQHFGFILYAGESNNWEAWVGDGATGPWPKAVGPAITPGKHYVAATYNGTTLKLYVDPVSDSPFPTDTTYVPNTANELRIGAGANEVDPLYFMKGVIDEVAIYNVDLDFSIIQTHYSLATTGSVPET